MNDIELWHGDCLELMNNIPDKSIDLILCDLPYGTTQCKWDTVIPFEPLWNNYSRIVKDNGVIALNCTEPFTSQLITSNIKDFKYKIVWEKSKATNFLNAKKQPLRKYEEVAIFYKKQPTYNPQFTYGEAYNKGVRKDQLTGSYGDFRPVEVKSNGERFPTDILYFKTAESEGKVYHPTQKPTALCENMIKTYTNDNDLVLDNCMGSGTTGIAAKRLHRRFIGIETDNTYFNIACKRINSKQIQQ